MSEEVKKISFGFSKLAKKTAIVPSKLVKKKPEEEEVEFIDCLEGKSIKLKDPVKLEQKPLVIPLNRLKDKTDNLTAKVDSETSEQLSPHNPLCEEQIKDQPNGTGNETVKPIEKVSQITVNDNLNKCESLDEIAEREILEELNRKKDEEEKNRVFSVPLTSNAPSGEKESTIEDYENVPVNEFGVAMLRGMGWAPGKGIGKNEKLVAPSLPAPRPKGMGLGADKVIKISNKNTIDEDLKMVKGSYVRVLAGPDKDAYGQIEGFDDESGRLIVKLALKTTSISLNEFMVQLVSKQEYIKNSKVINVTKYEQYKVNEIKKETTSNSENSKRDNDSCKNSKYNFKYSSAKSRKEEKNYSSSSDSDENENVGTKTTSNFKTRDSVHKERSDNSSESEANCREKNRSTSQSKSHTSHVRSYDRCKSQEKYSRNRPNERKFRSKSTDSSSSSDSYYNKNRRNRPSSKAKKSSYSEESPCKMNRRRRSRSHSSNEMSGSRESTRYSKDKKEKRNEYLPKRKSRSRSRSPKKHKSHKKHKKNKR